VDQTEFGLMHGSRSVRPARPAFTTATVADWLVALKARGPGAVSINVRITAVRKLAAEAADNGLLAPERDRALRIEGTITAGVACNWFHRWGHSVYSFLRRCRSRGHRLGVRSWVRR
jgi:hypothetical protein